MFKRKINSQMISEIVGNGHPDIVADTIASMINSSSNNSATEIIINSKKVFCSGETDLIEYESDVKKNIKLFLKDINKQYVKKHRLPKIEFCFTNQNKELKIKKHKLLFGDQEVVYYNLLSESDVHFWLKKLNEKVKALAPYLDYKVLVNMYNKTANLSISKSHKNFLKAKEFILDFLQKIFKLKIEKINVCEFEGGTYWNDTGVTGRKLIVEKDGCGFPHGGGAYFGKDKSKSAVIIYDELIKKAKKENCKKLVGVSFPNESFDDLFIKDLTDKVS